MSTRTETPVQPPAPEPSRRSGELGLREMGRWGWRQITSMRTALVLLLLLALAAVPGSVIPQEGVDSLKTSRWQADHPTLTPIYERLGLFSVYDSPWFSAIYLLLMVSLVGCIIPRTFVYLRAIRTPPPPAPRNLTRLPDHASYGTDDGVDEVLARARVVLKERGYRLRPAQDGSDAVSAERGYLREVGNLVFHLSVVVVLVGFALGGLFGFRGGAVITQGSSFANTISQYDDFEPGSLFSADQMDPFVFTFDSFDVEWQRTNRGVLARAFNAALTYREQPGSPEETYDLRVNHPLGIGDTDVFLIGHGYAPVITVTDGEGTEVYSGPTPFLPQDQSFLSFGVVKSPDAQPGQIGLEGLLYPTFELVQGNPVTLYPDDLNPLLSLSVFTGDLGLDTPSSQSVYVLDKTDADQVLNEDGTPLRLDLSIGETIELPDGLGSVTFEGVQPWARIQFSQTPGKEVALLGVVLALIGMCGSLFIRPRRVWVRAVPAAGQGAGATMVEVAALDRSGGGDVAPVLEEIVTELRATAPPSPPEEKS